MPDSGEYKSGSRNVKQLEAEIQTGEHILIPLPEPKGLESSIWNSRAWTLQERLLSRRLMIFIGGEMVWRCRETVAFEDMTAADTGKAPESFPWLSIKPQYFGINARRGYIDGSIVRSRDGGTEIVRSATFTEYVKVVEEYTHRQITHQSDILKAVSGLLHILERSFKRPMNYGLPECLLDVAILWRPAELLRRRSQAGHGLDGLERLNMRNRIQLKLMSKGVYEEFQRNSVQSVSVLCSNGIPAKRISSSF
jgi:hypothetical protein